MNTRRYVRGFHGDNYPRLPTTPATSRGWVMGAKHGIAVVNASVGSIRVQLFRGLRRVTLPVDSVVDRPIQGSTVTAVASVGFH
ncbi:hypothetical protein OUZ56_016824 [Daphnia magna]|uniref:Uncharacterized protein n=1 Tax=Daphnia magna TaxID=35525 RepID=A0ABR0ARM8_9CRUS|nr:hypothetical protein OUZ56_016824 [Daphnia magna]